LIIYSQGVPLFELDLKYLGAVIIGLAIALRPYIFKRLKVKGLVAHAIYFFIFMIIVVPLNMYKPSLTFTSLNDKSSKELIEKVLKLPIFSNFTNKIKNIEWKPYPSSSNLYNIKANIYQGAKEYIIYLQPACSFLNGCEIGLDKILIVEKQYQEYAVDTITDNIYNKRICHDSIVQDMLKEKIKSAIDVYAVNMNKIPNINFKYKIQSLNVNNFREIEKKFSKGEVPKNYKLSNICEADFTLHSFFKVEDKPRKELASALYMLFDNVTVNDNNYTISSIVKYEVYTSDGEVIVHALPFNIKKQADLQ